jgi:FkbH-like protein
MNAILISSTFFAAPLAAPLQALLGRHVVLRVGQPDQIMAELLAASDNGSAGTLRVVLPRSQDWPAETRAANWAQLEQALRALAARASVLVALVDDEALEVPGASVVRVPGMSQHALSACDELGTAYTPAGHAALANALARVLLPPLKLVVVDGDETLWHGVCAEDGIDGVRPHVELQRFLLGLRERGVLLALASKNEERDAAAVLARSDMILQAKHLSSTRIGWQAKSDSIRDICDELGVALESALLLDNDVVECAEVEINAAPCRVLRLPATMDALRSHPYFEVPKPTTEAAGRAAFMAHRAERELLRETAFSFDDFLRQLDLEVAISDMAPDDAERVAELLLRTTQFNCSGRRRAAEDLRHLPVGCAAVARVKDRFGDYGLVGVMIGQAQDDALEVDTFALSCRALNRGVEQRMLRWLGARAQREGLATLRIRWQPTERNTPARQFLESVASLQGDCAVLSAAKALESRAPVPPRAPQADAGLVPASVVRQPYEAPRSDVERHIVALFEELLDIEPIGIHDSFFALGGHSLLAAQVLTRLGHELKTPLSMRRLFTDVFTPAALARTVTEERARRAEPKRLQEMLSKVRGMSPEQLQELLAPRSPEA